jgi:hypothetical protein
VCGALFFWRGAPDEDEYLHSALDIKREAAKCEPTISITDSYLSPADMAEITEFSARRDERGRKEEVMNEHLDSG